MTLVACPPMWVPDPSFWSGTASPAFTSTLLDAAADRVAAVFRAPKTGNLKKIEVRFGTVTAINAASTLDIGFQDVDLTTGDPDGTFDQSVAIVAASVVTNTTHKADLGASVRAVTAGDLVAVVCQYGTFTAGDQVNVNGGISSQTRSGPQYYEYTTVNTTGAYGKSAAVIGCFSVEYDDGTFAYTTGLLPVIVSGTVALNTGTTPDVAGLRFTLPFPCKIGRAFVGCDADGDYDLVLYTSTARTVLVSLDKDVRSSALGSPGFIPFPEQTLGANVEYVLAVEPTSATSVTLHYVDVASAAVLGQLNGGTAFHYGSAKDPATLADFTMLTTRRPMMGIAVTAADDGASAGGSRLFRRRG